MLITSSHITHTHTHHTHTHHTHTHPHHTHTHTPHTHHTHTLTPHTHTHTALKGELKQAGLKNTEKKWASISICRRHRAGLWICLSEKKCRSSWDPSFSGCRNGTSLFISGGAEPFGLWCLLPHTFWPCSRHQRLRLLLGTKWQHSWSCFLQVSNADFEPVQKLSKTTTAV